MRETHAVERNTVTSNPQVAEIERSQPKTISTLVAAFVAAAIAYVLFTNSDATAHQTNPLSGSGEVMQGSLTPPGAGPSVGDPSVPNASEALSRQGFDRVPAAVRAPSF